MLAFTKRLYLGLKGVTKWPKARFHNFPLMMFRGVKCENIILYKYATDKLD